jgi:hypothetical protein
LVQRRRKKFKNIVTSSKFSSSTRTGIRLEPTAGDDDDDGDETDEDHPAGKFYSGCQSYQTFFRRH